jgi:hypothetical protein
MINRCVRANLMRGEAVMQWFDSFVIVFGTVFIAMLYRGKKPKR